MLSSPISPKRARSKAWTWLALVLLLGFAAYLRFTAVAETVVDHPVRADARDYVTYAYNLKFRDTYSRAMVDERSPPPAPDAVRSPGYPLFLAIFLDNPPTFGNLDAVLRFQAVLSLATVALVFFLARQVMTGPWALLPTALTAASPHMVNLNVYLLSEVLFSLLLVVSILAIHIASSRSIPGRALIAGGVSGITYLVRPTALLLPVVAILHFIHVGLSRRIRISTWFLIGFLLACGPWLAWKTLAVQQGGSDRLQINFLHHGMYPGFVYQGKTESFGFPYRHDPRAKEISQDTHSVLLEIQRRFREEPERHLQWYLVGKPLMLWSWNIVQGMGDSFIYPVKSTPYASNKAFQLSHQLMRWLHVPITMLAFTGILLIFLPGCRQVMDIRKLRSLQLLATTLLLLTGFHMIGTPFPRYALPAYPLLYVMAVATFWLLISAAGSRLRGAWSTTQSGNASITTDLPKPEAP